MKFDELELNKALCDRENVEIAGVIINKVQPDKLAQTAHYIRKALALHWGDVPLLGCIPDRPFLGCPALSDLERLFQTKLMTGDQHRMRHYKMEDLNLVATSLAVFLRNLSKKPSRTLYLCHASRNDILLGFLLEHPNGVAHRGESALIVTGTDEYPLSQQVMDIIHGSNMETAPPVLLAPYSTNKVMEMIHKFTPKLNFEDSNRSETAIEHYEPHIDFDLLLERTGHNSMEASSA
jgi:BioD-like phosphotransacetylase family protein